jgi:hypothetical protein
MRRSRTLAEFRLRKFTRGGRDTSTQQTVTAAIPERLDAPRVPGVDATRIERSVECSATAATNTTPTPPPRRMSRIEELPDDFEAKVSMESVPEAAAGSAAPVDLIDQMISQAVPFPPKPGYNPKGHGIGPAMPPAMENIRQYTADEVVTMLNRTPLFMTTLDETDGQGGVNEELEAFRALAYEGTRAEVADNFREQGNEQARVKRWTPAKGFYDQALATLRAPQTEQPEDTAEIDIVQLDAEEEAKKEKVIEEACYVNRALCNLELSKRPLDEVLVITSRADLISKRIIAPATSTVLLP